MQGAHEPIGPVVLLAEFYSSGGTRTYLKQLLHFYSALKIDVLLISQHERLDDELACLVDRLGFAYRSYSSVLRSGDSKSGALAQLRPWSMRRQLTERRVFAKLVAQVDARALVISVGTPGLFAGASGASSRSLYILHTYPHGRRQKYLGRWFMARLFGRTPHFLAVSEFQKSMMEKTWRLRKRAADIHVVPNTAGPVPSTRATWTSVDPMVLTASWVEPYKEPGDWLEIARSVSERRTLPTQFVWLGEGSGLEAMKARTYSDGIHETAEFRGHAADTEEAYREATLYVQTSSTENMSLSVIDALRWGLPAVVTDVGGLPEIIVDSACGYIVPVHDVERASDRICHLLEDEALWMQMSRRARERYELVFSPDVWRDSLIRVHERVMSGMATPDTLNYEGDA